METLHSVTWAFNQFHFVAGLLSPKHIKMALILLVNPNCGKKQTNIGLYNRSTGEFNSMYSTHVLTSIKTYLCPLLN